MKTANLLDILKNEIHTTIMATVDREGHPVTRVIDVMLVDDKTLYFITAKGKDFYRQLMEQKYVSISGACGGEGIDKREASIHMKAISIRGTVQNIGDRRLEEVFEQNPYMKEIYPDAASQRALEVFCMTEGTGEFFDLSVKPIRRESFVIGLQEENAEEKSSGYYITDACIGCGACTEVCPQKCIEADDSPLKIRQENCLHCGNCMAVCPAGAVKKGIPEQSPDKN